MQTLETLWPDDCAGAVSLTFDDAIPCHITRVAPILDAHGLRGTFYVNPRADWVANAAAWRTVHADGHEIGNHTLSHPCSRNFGWNAAQGLEDMTLEEVEEDIRRGREALAAAIPAQTAHSFCYPCYQDFVGRGPTRRSYVPIVTKYHTAARGRGETFNDPRHADLHYVWSYPCERMSGAEMIGLCEQAARSGGWAVLTFHGVGEAHLMVGESDFTALCAHLAHHRARLWTATFLDAAQRIAAWRENVIFITG